MKKQSSVQETTKTEDPAESYRKRTKEVQAQHDYVQTVDALMNPQSLQEMRMKHEQQLQEQAAEAKRQAEEMAQRDRERMEHERAELQKAAQEEHERRVDLERQLQASQHQILMEKLNELQGSQKPLQQQLDEYAAFAERMGYQKQSEMPATQDPRMAIELEKMRLDAARESRQFEWQMEQDKRKWEIEMERLRQEREFKKQELDQAAKKDELFASLPQRIGGAIAQGLLDREQGGAPPPGHVGQQAPQQRTKVYRIDIGEGRAAEVPCPDCQSPVGVGPTSTASRCVNCSAQFTVARHPAHDVGGGPPPPDAGAESQEPPDYYEEDQ